MAVAFQEKQTSSGAASTSVVLSTNSLTIASGDLLVAFFATGASATNDVQTPPSGWSTALRGTSSEGEILICSWRVATGADVGASSYTWTMTESRVFHGNIARYTGHDTSTPVPATDSSMTSESSAGTSHPTGSITPDAANSLIVAYWIVGSGSATWTLDGTLTSRYNASLQSLPTCFGDVALGSPTSTSKTSTTSSGQTGANVILAIAVSTGGGTTSEKAGTGVIGP